MKERILPARLAASGQQLYHDLRESEAAQKGLRHAAYFAAGCLASRGVVFGRHAPFGVAAAAACPRQVMWSTALGSLVGYLLPGGSSFGGRYLVALLLMLGLRWTLSEIPLWKNSILFYSGIASLPVFGTGMFLAILDGSAIQTWILYGTESVLAGASVYFLHRTSLLLETRRSPASLQQGELACVIFALGIGILSLSSMTIGFLSLGRIAAVLLILFSCRYGGVAGGSLSGIVAGAMFGLATSGINGISGALAFAGLIGGLFSPFGKIATAAAFVLANGFGSLQVGSTDAVISGILEVMAASLIFVIWPDRVGRQLATIFHPLGSWTPGNGLRRVVVQRLNSAASAMAAVSESVEAVSEKLEQVDTATMDSVYKNTLESVCASCGNRRTCWSSPREARALCSGMTEVLRITGELRETDLPPVIAKRCPVPATLTGSINRNYRDYLAKESAERKLRQVRSVVTEQFATAGDLLQEMAEDLRRQERFDLPMERKMAAFLQEHAVQTSELCCRRNAAGRRIMEFVVPPMAVSRIRQPSFRRELTRLMGQALTEPVITQEETHCVVQIMERPLFQVRHGMAQHSCRNASLCGDHAVCFADAEGRQIAILSDGMGTGGRAAVDGTMASGIMARMLQSGISFDCALQITNSALMAKSGTETLATLDVASVDRFTGAVELRKAGAPVSFVRKQGAVRRLDAISLPVGILEDAVFAKTTTTLEAGDLLVLFSDGVIAAGEAWVARLLEDWQGAEPRQLAEQIVETAVRCRRDGKEDDVTALVLQLLPQ